MAHMEHENEKINREFWVIDSPPPPPSDYFHDFGKLLGGVVFDFRVKIFLGWVCLPLLKMILRAWVIDMCNNILDLERE